MSWPALLGTSSPQVWPWTTLITSHLSKDHYTIGYTKCAQLLAVCLGLVLGCVSWAKVILWLILHGKTALMWLHDSYLRIPWPLDQVPWDVGLRYGESAPPSSSSAAQDEAQTVQEAMASLQSSQSPDSCSNLPYEANHSSPSHKVGSWQSFSSNQMWLIHIAYQGIYPINTATSVVVIFPLLGIAPDWFTSCAEDPLFQNHRTIYFFLSSLVRRWFFQLKLR